MISPGITPFTGCSVMYWMFKLPLFAKSDFSSCVTCPPGKAHSLKIFRVQEVILYYFAADNREGSVVTKTCWRHTFTIFLQWYLSVWGSCCVFGCLIIQLCFPQRTEPFLNIFTFYLPHNAHSHTVGLGRLQKWAIFFSLLAIKNAILSFTDEGRHKTTKIWV